MTAGDVTLMLVGAIAAAAGVLWVTDRVRGVRPDQPSALARVLIGLLAGYRLIGRVRVSSCRFTPSCSEYAVGAVRRYGAVRGSWLTARRLLRCGPWHPGGHDPVPAAVGNGREPAARAGEVRPGAPDWAPPMPTGASSC